MVKKISLLLFLVFAFGGSLRAESFDLETDICMSPIVLIFDHTADDYSGDAIDMSYDDTQDLAHLSGSDIGEWQLGDMPWTVEPVYYAGEKMVTVKAKLLLLRTDPSIVFPITLNVRAQGIKDLSCNLIERQVTFYQESPGSDYAVSNFVHFNADRATHLWDKDTLKDFAYIKNARFQWIVKTLDLAQEDQKALTYHYFYTAFATGPVGPWTDGDSTVEKKAQEKILKYVEAIAGVKNQEDKAIVLKKITKYLHTSAGFSYNSAGMGQGFYATKGNATSETWYKIKLEAYVDKSLGTKVNCYDQAVATSALGALIGVDSTPKRLGKMTPGQTDTYGYIMTTKIVGSYDCNNPFWNNASFYSEEVVPSDFEQFDIHDANENVPTFPNPTDELLDRSYFGSHCVAVFNGMIYDATVGPAIGTKNLADYMTLTLQKLTPEQILKGSGQTSPDCQITLIK